MNDLDFMEAVVFVFGMGFREGATNGEKVISTRDFEFWDEHIVILSL
jgi:hypothetical protein